MTIRALQTGSGFAISLLLAAIVLDFLGYDIGRRAAFLGVAALIATPALALAATSLETWARDRPTALLAAAVLALLGVAIGIALFIGG